MSPMHFFRFFLPFSLSKHVIIIEHIFHRINCDFLFHNWCGSLNKKTIFYTCYYLDLAAQMTKGRREHKDYQRSGIGRVKKSIPRSPLGPSLLMKDLLLSAVK